MEVDHKNRDSKKFTLSQKWINLKWEVLVEELKKCQLLCRSCHRLKSIADLGKKVAKGNHGTVSSYRYCKCGLCKEAHREATRKYYKTRKRITVNGKRIVIKKDS